MSALQKLTGWLKSEGDLQGHVDRLEALKREHEAAKPMGIDPAEHRAWREKLRALDDDIASHKESLRIASEQRALAQQKADEAKRDVEEREILKLAEEHAKLTIEIESGERRLVPKLDRLRECERRIEDWNARRGDRAFVVDGEAKVRGTPARTEPAVFETRVVWKDSAGRTPGIWRIVDGQQVPGDHGSYSKVREKVQVRPERYVPAAMPPRLADEIRLVGLKGERLWPRT